MLRRSSPWLRCLLAYGLLLAGAAGVHAATERGFPLIQTVEPELREASTQSFGITRDRRGVIYIANLAGVLVYDGAWWRLIEIGQGQTAFSVASDSAGRIGVGGVDDLGYLEPDKTGTLRFVSLLSHLPAGQRRFGQILNVLPTDNGFAYLTTSWLAFWDGQRFTTVARFPAERPFADAFQWGEESYFWTREGIFRLAGRRLEPVPGGAEFRGRRVDVLLPAGNDGLLVSVREEGLFLLQNGRTTPFAPEASRWAAEKRLLEGLRLPDGRWALGSILGGLLLLRPDGQVDQVIDTTVGLPDDFVYGMELDHEGSLWLALNSGLVRVEVSSPLSVIDRRAGLQGSVYGMTRHQGNLWVATAAGVFTADPGAASAAPEWGQTVRMRAVPGLPPSGWSVLSRGEDLLVGTAFGVFRLRGGDLQPIRDVGQETAFALVPSVSDPDRVWAGLADGLAALRRDGTEWRLEGRVQGVPPEIRNIVESNGVLWCGTSLDGLVRVELPPGGPGAPGARVRRIGAGEAIHVFRVGGRILVVRDGKVMRLDEARGEIVADPALASLGGPEGLSSLAEDAGGNLWLNTRPPSIASRQGDGWAAEPRPLPEVAASHIEAIFAEPDGVVWLGAEDGLFRYAGVSQSQGNALPAPHLSAIRTGNALLFGGAPGVAPGSLEVPLDARRLRIEFAPLSFRAGLRYQTRLEPVDADWNEPAPEPFTELTRLPAGRYTFRVRTVGPNQETGPEASWSFRVRPPWYLTPWALALWAVLAVAGIRGYAWLRSRALQQRAAVLEARVAEQTDELRRTVDELRQAHSELAEANSRLREQSLQDELTGIPNRRRMRQAVEDEWNRALDHGLTTAFILVDLDYFKLLNDTRGHREGDECLKAVGRYLADAVERAGGLAARYGGEEFAILLPATGLPGALTVAEQLREGIEALDLPHEAAPLGHITASFGVAALSTAPGQRRRRPDALIEAADLALYRAKTDGRNRVFGGHLAPGDTGEVSLLSN